MRYRSISHRKFRRLPLLGLLMILPLLICTAARKTNVKKAGVAEQVGKINVAFLGSSAMYRYIIPQLLWKEDGVTSCLIGRPAQSFDEMPSQLEIAMQSTQPTLYVIEIRRLIMNDIERKSEKTKQNVLRNSQGTLNIQNTINELLKQLSLPFATENAWDGPQNTVGEILTVGSVRREKQWDPSVDRNKTAPLEKQSLDTLHTVLYICKTHKLNVLFVSTPYVEKPAFIREENTAAQIIESAGFAYHNYNYDYSALGLNFWTDFYDQRHVNTSGAIKMTNAIAACLKGEHFFYGGTASSDAYWADSYQSWAKKAAAQEKKIKTALKNSGKTAAAQNLSRQK